MEMQVSGLLIKGIGILILTIIAVGITFGVVCLARLFFQLKKLNQRGIMYYYFLLVVCILTMISSWIFNIGWYRVILTWLAFPVVHLVIFSVINGRALLKAYSAPKLKTYIRISYVTCFFSYLLFPDGGDTGAMYAIFGLIHDNAVAHIAGILSMISFIVYISCTVFQVVEMNKMERMSR